MNKKEFFEEMRKAVVGNLKKEYENIDAEIKTVTKNNGLEYTGLSFKGDANIQPVMYLDASYEDFEYGKREFDEIVSDVCDSYRHNRVSGDINLDELLNYESAKSHLTVVLRNADRNADMLENVPHDVHADLVEMYRIEIANVGGGNGSVLINNDVMAKLGVDAETLKNDAWNNMRSIHPGELKNMLDVFREMSGGEIPDEFVDAMMENRPQMYVYSNNDKFNGASYMVDKEAMSKVAEELGESFAILPSSIHEFICLKESDIEGYNALKSMVEEVNATQVSPDEVLSDNVYRFDAETQELTMFDGNNQTMGMNM